MSAFAGATNGASVRSATTLTARPKPTFSSSESSCTSGNSERTISADPSPDALSTTHTSASGSSASEARHSRSRSRVFQETTATAISGGTAHLRHGRGAQVPQDLTHQLALQRGGRDDGDHDERHDLDDRHRGGAVMVHREQAHDQHGVGGGNGRG